VDGKGKIEREIENVFGAKARPSEFLASSRCCGDQDSIVRALLAKLLHHAADGQHLPDRNGMNPDSGLF
jgi:hypothetical protein